MRYKMTRSEVNNIRAITDFHKKMETVDHAHLNKEKLAHGPFTIEYDGKDWWYEGCDTIRIFMEVGL